MRPGRTNSRRAQHAAGSLASIPSSPGRPSRREARHSYLTSKREASRRSGLDDDDHTEAMEIAQQSIERRTEGICKPDFHSRARAATYETVAEHLQVVRRCLAAQTEGLLRVGPDDGVKHGGSRTRARSVPASCRGFTGTEGRLASNR